MMDPVVDPADRLVEPLRSLKLAHIAKRYYEENKSKVEIAEEFGISRFRVARLIDDALAEGIVRIEIRTPTSIDADLSLELEGRFRLERAVVVTAAEFSDDKGVRLAVAKVAAALVAEILTSDDVVGVGWGRTLHDLVSELPPLPPCTAVQVVGGMPEVELWMNSVDLVRRFSERAKGPMHTFLLPYLVNDDLVGAGLQSDPSFVAAKKLFGSLTVVVAGVGSWDPPRSGLFDLLTPTERYEIHGMGVVADMFGTLINGSGNIVPSPLEARSTGITADDLGLAPSLIAVAAGVDKAKALGAALRSGLISSVVTDSGVASALLGDGSVD